MAATINGRSILFGVADPEGPVSRPRITKDSLELPEDVVYWKTHEGPEEFTTIYLIRRRNQTVFHESWFLKLRGRKYCLAIQQESLGRYNEEWRNIWKAGYVIDVRRGAPPLDTPLLVFCTPAGEKPGWHTAVIREGSGVYLVQSTIDDWVIEALSDIQNLPWLRLPEDVDTEETPDQTHNDGN